MKQKLINFSSFTLKIEFNHELIIIVLKKESDYS